MATALIVGSSDGIGLALARTMLAAGWRVTGISRSAAPIDDPAYTHTIADVTDAGYRDALAELVGDDGPDVCVYCAGIGESLELADLSRDLEVFDVNLVGALSTVAVVVPGMLAAGGGHFIGLSSQADTFVNADAPSYSASKAGLSAYLHGLALALRPHGVFVTNVRFGFVDTKMAKSDVRPFMISADRAAELIMRCVKKRPISFTYPKRMAGLLWFLRWGPRLRVWWS
jgi:NAD(P)-dependent dehydrogenase (short-subunit alcohol dehydrogenase family)